MTPEDFAAIDALPVTTREKIMQLATTYGQCQFNAGVRITGDIEEFFAATASTNAAHDALLSFLYPLSHGTVIEGTNQS